MKTLFRLLLLSAVTASALGLPAFSPSASLNARAADDDDDHEQARAALQQHKALPLAQILERIRPKLGGRIVGIEFEQEDGQYFYEIKIVTPDGQMREVYVDAGTAHILENKAD